MKRHPGAQERAQGVDHHDEGAFSGLKVCVSKTGRWWYEVKMQCVMPHCLADMDTDQGRH